MTGETISTSGAFFSDYRKADHEWAYEFHAIGSDVEAGLINPQSRDEALRELQICAEDPHMKGFMTLHQWQVSPDAAPHERYGVTWSQPGEQAREMDVDADNMPPVADQLLGHLFVLTGASIVRDDLKEEGDSQGVIIRRGSYKGAEVYFRETYSEIDKDSLHYDDSRTSNPQRSLGVEIMGAARGEVALIELSAKQKASLDELIGVEAAQTVSDAGHSYPTKTPLVNRDNFYRVRNLLRSAADTEKDKIRTGILQGGRIRRFLASLAIDSKELFPPKPKPIARISRKAYERHAQDPYVRALIARVQERMREHPEDFSSGQAR